MKKIVLVYLFILLCEFGNRIMGRFEFFFMVLIMLLRIFFLVLVELLIIIVLMLIFLFIFVSFFVSLGEMLFGLRRMKWSFFFF